MSVVEVNEYNLKSGELHQDTSSGEYDSIEGEICLLEEDDMQCGHIFFNETTRVLKFFCSFCRETYDNINYFCEHLGDHINEEEEAECVEDVGGQTITDRMERVAGKSSVDVNDDVQGALNAVLATDELDSGSGLADKSEPELEPEPEPESEQMNGLDFREVDDAEMIVEELDEAEEIAAEVEQEMRQAYENECNLLDDDSCSKDFLGYEEEGDESVYRSKSSHSDGASKSTSFEECFLKETDIEKIRNVGVSVIKERKVNRNVRRKPTMQELLRMKRKKKKVTTVKVIAMKNRIAELYERIKKEEQKRSEEILASNSIIAAANKMNVDEFNSLTNHTEMVASGVSGASGASGEQEVARAVEAIISDSSSAELTSNNNSSTAAERTSPSSLEMTRKIIGETVITLIPEGSKIPDTLPCPVDPNKSVAHKAVEDENCKPLLYGHYSRYGSDDQDTTCPACGKRFRSSFSLTIHKRTHYLESDSSIKLAHKCSDCDQLFNKMSQLKEHVETVHYPEGFICKICDRKLSSLSLLERHMRKVHLNRPFNCKECGKNFDNRVTYDEHLISHASGDIHKCHICGRKYPTEYFLMQHMRNHKEQIPQTCVVCGKVTLRITQHMKIHTPRPKRLLSCSVCGKTFNFSSGLSHHFKVMHKDPRPPPKPKKESSNPLLSKHRKLHHHRPIGKREDVETMSPSTSFLEQTSQQVVTQKVEELPQLLQEDVNHKEEEAKRVIVELIQNSTYTSFFPNNLSNVLEEVTPPIAREETISAVNSIVHDC